ncbi:MAG: peptidoglycan editing factor PgeF [Elusimicrobiota bacterium]|jgi:YfiH family protein|nr:peptidoglycan editing factor PgeF [Elusimicrobiota bacterium]
MKPYIFDEKFAFNHLSSLKVIGDMKDIHNSRSLFSSLNLNSQNFVCANQVHSNNIKIVEASDKSKIIEGCDGLITSEKSLMLGVFTADCLPVLMVDTCTKVKAAVHAGWRGLESNILKKAVGIFNSHFKSKLQNIKVYIAPHIQKCCYEVSEELGRIFGIELENGRLDLSAIAFKELEEAGLVGNNILISQNCTFCQNIFFSYRRDKCRQRMLTVIWD